MAERLLEKEYTKVRRILRSNRRLLTMLKTRLVSDRKLGRVELAQLYQKTRAASTSI